MSDVCGQWKWSNELDFLSTSRGATLRQLLIIGALTALPCPAQDFSASSPSTNENGVITYTVSSAWNAPSTTPLRVLVPENPSNVVARFIFVLPVEPEPQNGYGDGIEVLRTNLAHEICNAVLVEPQFQSACWYGDNDSETDKQYETFVVQGVVPWVRTNFSRTGNEKIYLIGFSKSGYGAISLLTRNPTVFEGAAAWDFPANMSDYSAMGASDTYGSNENFTNNYRLSIENISARKDSFQTGNRIWISGDHSYFEASMYDFDAMLTGLGMLHTMDDPTGSETRWHRWDSGWTTNAVQWLGSSPAETNVENRLTINRSGSNVILTWPGTGTLQAAPDAGGPYTNIPNATTGYTVPVVDRAFFRLQFQ